ncbi:hypothetical protein AURANDRAFT_69377, partial [Aureococcus anophagefferens]
PEDPLYNDLLKKLLNDIDNGLMDVLGLKGEALPLLWTCDYIPKNPEGWSKPGNACAMDTEYVVGEFNCSCVGVSKFQAVCGGELTLADVSDADYFDGCELTDLMGKQAIKMLKATQKKKIAVVGSANFDTTYAVGAKLPTAGETVVTGGAPATCCGGKGLNQAVAAARVGGAGVAVEFAARVGDDAAADAVRSALADAGVGAARVAATAAAGTGLGVVLLEDGGEVLSVVVRGANFAGWDGGEAWDDLVAGASALLLQREIPEAVNAAAAAAAKRAGGVIVLQDAGGEDRPLDPEHVANCDYLSPNLSELRRL